MFTGADHDRLIFRFWNGERTVSADPAVIQRRYAAAAQAAGVDLDQVYKDLEHEVPDVAEQATAKLLPIVCEAFGVRPLDDEGRGLTEVGLADLLRGFHEFVADLKNEPGPTPSGSGPTDGPPAPAPSVTSSGTGCN